MSWIITASGRRLDYLLPTEDNIYIEDIATALSRESRFNGHTKAFYSVAQHCVVASQIVRHEFRLEALLHDATEAYMKDLPRPLKQLLPDYQEIEDRLDAVIRGKFGLPASMSPHVKSADLVLLATERRDLRIPDDGSPWTCLEGVKPLRHRITPWEPDTAKDLFLDQFRFLWERGK